MSPVLADRISVQSRFARSANVERDLARPEPLDGYVVTARVLDILARIATTAGRGQAGGAWSLTGPYGTGKSSLALLIDAAFGPPTPTRETAFRLIGEASPETEGALRAAHEHHGTWNTGFCRGLVTATREPLRLTVLRALRAAYAGASKGTESPAVHALRGALRDADAEDPPRTGPNPASIVQIARALAEEAPLLLIIDEFGKTLEAASDGHEDPYLLQQLAEAGQGSGLPIFLLTLQHLSFEEYFAASAGPARREWAKVQGRFGDMPFVESAEQLRALIGGVFAGRDAAIKRRIARWAAHHSDEMGGVGISEVADPDIVASCYPLHPLTAMVLPEMCTRYGQNERTLFSFLTSQDPASAKGFLAATGFPRRGLLPSLGLEYVYDYFVASSVLGGLTGQQSSRWSEIAIRLRDVTGLSESLIRMAKRIAVLNLIATTGVVRASRALLALTEPHADVLLADLEAAGIVTYRDFADEYRIWQGSEIDIGLLLERGRTRIRRRPLVEVLSAMEPLDPVVAARHSAEYDVLRIFKRRYADAARPVDPVDPFTGYDGEALLVVDSIDVIPSLAKGSNTAKPIVAAIPRDVTRLDEAAREALAVRTSLKEPLVENDWVVRRELAERMAQARANLDTAVHDTFSADACRWILLEPSGGRGLPSGPGGHALANAADIAYERTPIIGNEVLNRTRLTSQGAKARRLLIGAMIDREGDPDLGLDGNGPEVAMYRAFLQRTGIHRPATSGGGFRLGEPFATDSLAPAWEVLEDQFARAKACRVNLRDLYGALLSSPIGMKEGVIPVFVTAALLAARDEIAIYEHGTFRPLLAIEVSERMVRNPHHFDIKHFANTTGARRSVVNALARQLGVRPAFRQYRVANVLEIAGHLVLQFRRLDNFTLRTRSMSPDALAVRAAIRDAVEPDELLFDRLPECFALPAVSADAHRYLEEASYAQHLGSAMEELKGRYAKLEEELLALLLGVAAEKTRLAVSGQAAALDGEVLDQAVRTFVQALKGDSAKNDGEWISTIAAILSKKAPKEWTDHDLAKFEHELRVQVAAFQRLLALHVEGRAGGAGPFQAFRVTVTRPDGREHDRLVALDDIDRPLAERILEDALAKLEGDLGSKEQAEKVLLACLGERLLPHADQGNPKPMNHKVTRTRHA